MFRAQSIQSLDGAELQPYRTMRQQVDHRKQGIFVAEGEKVVRRLLESTFKVVSVLLPQKWLTELEPILQRRPELIEVYIAEKKLLETLTGFSMYQGLLAVGKVPNQPSLDEVLERSSQPHLLVAADGISSAENMGALVRNCAAFQVQALVVSENCCSPFLRRAVRSSMGTIFEMPVVESISLVQALQELKSRSIRCIAADAHVKGRTVAQANFTSDCCIVFGSEGYGISASALAESQDVVAIPMAQNVDSLNIGSAAAVFLYEANRQRGRL